MDLYEKTKTEKEHLEEENKTLNDIIKSKQKEITKFEEKLTTTKLAKMMLSSSDDVHEAKLKVNRIVREIDRCIALLNK